jgi:hypothetical protein
MSNYVLSFRSPKDAVPSGEEEQAWMQWFGTIGSSIVEQGTRVGDTRTLGAAGDGRSALSGYTVVKAQSLDAAEKLAAGCPGLAHGATVEVGEAVDG